MPGCAPGGWLGYNGPICPPPSPPCNPPSAPCLPLAPRPGAPAAEPRRAARADRAHAGHAERLGIGRNDRVAIVLPNGPEMATCFMACASGVASAPLNPAYRADEFEFYLSDLNAKALIVEQRQHLAGHRRGAEAGRAPDRPGARHGARPAASRCSRATAPAAPPPTAAMPQPTTCRWCCTPRAPPRGPRSCRCRRATWRPRPPTSAHAAVHGHRLRPEHHAAVPHPRPDRRRAGAAGGGLAGVLHAGLQRAEVLRLDGRGQAHLVHRRAHHAPGHHDARAARTWTSSRATRCASCAARPARCRRRSSPNSKPSSRRR
jgi:hypothetical protein